MLFCGQRGRLFLLVVMAIGVASCSRGSPELSAVDALPAIELDQPSKVISVLARANNFVLRGRCSALVDRLQLVEEGSADWQEISALIPDAVLTIDKSNCNPLCAFTLSSSLSVRKAFTSVDLSIAGTAKIFHLRGAGAFGESSPTDFTVSVPRFQIVGSINSMDRGIHDVKTSNFSVKGGRLASVGTGPTSPGGLRVKGVTQ
ncbi:MAG: hypothetical protein C5B49_04300 [Bdellovibrio sp.]|nr:MAG: hypothetical protein C5B49_04300 [Bdellovibrio sp.]